VKSVLIRAIRGKDFGFAVAFGLAGGRKLVANSCFQD
jgi:hypothetical protein